MSTLAAIRAATAADHEALETALDAVGALADPARRLPLLARYHAAWVPAGDALRAALPDPAERRFALDLAVRRLRADLRAYGVPEAAIAALPLAPVPRLPSRAHALGFAYVFAGAALGGRVIARRLQRNGIPCGGLSFFEEPAEPAAARFRALCALLDALGARDGDAAIGGARHGFAYVRKSLVGPAAAAPERQARAASA